MSKSESDSSASDAEFYEVERIVDHRINKQSGEMMYKVRWKGYAASQDTWEPYEHLKDSCEEVIDAYFQQASNKNKEKKGTEGNNLSNSPSKTNLKKSDDKKPEASQVANKEGVKSKKEAAKAPNEQGKTAKDRKSAKEKEKPVKGKNKDDDSKAETTNESVDIETINTKIETENISGIDIKSECVNDRLSHQKTKPKTSTSSHKKDANAVLKLAKAKPEKKRGKIRNEIVEEDDASSEDVEKDLPEETATTRKEHDELKVEQLEHVGDVVIEEETLQRKTISMESEDAVTLDESWMSYVKQLRDPELVDAIDVVWKLSDALTEFYNENKECKLTLIMSILINNLDSASFSDDVNSSLPGNWTALHFASALHNYTACSSLLQKGCWPDICTVNSETPLSLALKAECHDKAAMLQYVRDVIKSGANIHHVDHSNNSVLSLAKQYSPDVYSLVSSYNNGLMDKACSIVTTFVEDTPELELTDYFLTPRVVSLPPSQSYAMKFYFDPPNELCVARLILGYASYEESNLLINSNGIEPFSKILVNQKNILASQSGFDIALKSELVVGENTLELFSNTADVLVSQLSDLVMIFGCLIEKQSTEVEHDMQSD